VRLGREHDADRVAGAHLSSGHDGAHDARLADEPAVVVTLERRRHQARLNPVELSAGVSQAGHLDDRRRAEVEARAGRQREQLDAARGDVLPQHARPDREAGGRELVVELRMDQVDLPQVRLRGVSRHPGAVSDRLAEMRVALDAEPREQSDRVRAGLRERVRLAPAHGRHDGARRLEH
jgi:hypothetical protein